MNAEEERRVAELMRQALQRARGHADFFQWAPNRDVEEWGVVNYLRVPSALVPAGRRSTWSLALAQPTCLRRTRV